MPQSNILGVSFVCGGVFSAGAIALQKSSNRHSYSSVCGLYSAIPMSLHVVCFLIVSAFLVSPSASFWFEHGLVLHCLFSPGFLPSCPTSACLSQLVVVFLLVDVVGAAAAARICSFLCFLVDVLRGGLSLCF